jgi:hypothetical protein
LQLKLPRLAWGSQNTRSGRNEYRRDEEDLQDFPAIHGNAFL